MKPSKKQKTKLRIMNYFIEINIYFKKAIIKSRNLYCIHTNVDKAKILFIASSCEFTISWTWQVSCPLDNKDLHEYANFTTLKIL